MTLMWLMWLVGFSLARHLRCPASQAPSEAGFQLRRLPNSFVLIESNTSKCTRNFPCHDHVPLDRQCTATHRAFVALSGDGPQTLRLAEDISPPMTLLCSRYIACNIPFGVCSCSMPSESGPFSMVVLFAPNSLGFVSHWYHAWLKQGTNYHFRLALK
jgi:hypothetical protein